jgi:hypothetical protein
LQENETLPAHAAKRHVMAPGRQFMPENDTLWPKALQRVRWETGNPLSIYFYYTYRQIRNPAALKTGQGFSWMIYEWIL